MDCGKHSSSQRVWMVCPVRKVPFEQSKCGCVTLGQMSTFALLKYLNIEKTSTQYSKDKI